MTDTPPQLEGWTKWGGAEPFEDHVGPFFMKLDPEGRSAFIGLCLREAPPQWWRFSAWRHVDELCRLRAFRYRA